MRVPAFPLDQPILTEFPFVAEDRAITIDPVVIVRRDGLIRVGEELGVGQAARIFAAESAGVEVQGDELIFPKAISGIAARLPEIVGVMIALAVGRAIIAINAEFEWPGSLLNRAVTAVSPVGTSRSFKVTTQRTSGGRTFGDKVDRRGGLGAI